MKAATPPRAEPREFVSPARLRVTERGRIVFISCVVAVVAFLALAVPPLRAAASRTIGEVVLFALTPVTPDVSGFDDVARPTRVLGRDGRTQIASLGGSREDVPLDFVSRPMRRAVLSAEDSGFYEHAGVDPVAVVRPGASTIRGDVQGGSTITQQLAKLNYVGSHRTIFRKLKEVVYAGALERRYSKDELLERYLNQVSYGQGAYGIHAAAKRFFATTPDRLTAEQAATLAGKIRSPEHLDPWQRPDEVVGRRNQVLAAMLADGRLDDRTARAATTKPLVVVSRDSATESGHATQIAELVRREALELDALGSTRRAREKHLESTAATPS